MSGLACCKGPTISREKKEVNVSWDPLLSLFFFNVQKVYIFIYIRMQYNFFLFMCVGDTINEWPCMLQRSNCIDTKKEKKVSHGIHHCNCFFF